MILRHICQGKVCLESSKYTFESSQHNHINEVPNLMLLIWREFKSGCTEMTLILILHRRMLLFRNRTSRKQNFSQLILTALVKHPNKCNTQLLFHAFMHSRVHRHKENCSSARKSFVFTFSKLFHILFTAGSAVAPNEDREILLPT